MHVFLEFLKMQDELTFYVDVLFKLLSRQIVWACIWVCEILVEFDSMICPFSQFYSVYI